MDGHREVLAGPLSFCRHSPQKVKTYSDPVGALDSFQTDQGVHALSSSSGSSTCRWGGQPLIHYAGVIQLHNRSQGAE